MKKLVLAVIAAVAMVSVNTVFATNKMESSASVAPVDTIAPTDTTKAPVQPTDLPTDTTTNTPVVE